MCQEKKWEEDLPALRVALMDQHKDSIKKSKERLITAANNSIGNINTNWKTNKN